MSDFSSGRDLAVREFKPHIGLCTDSVEPAWDSLSASASASAPPSLMLSLKINKNKFKLKKKRMKHAIAFE